jgi:RNA polymerase sigma-70 factor (ECF subfamily)
LESLSPETLARLCRDTLPEDTRAFEALVAQFKERVYATTYRLMGNRQDAEDQAQEVFIKVYRGVRDLDDSSTVAAWIYRLTVNSCFDALRKRQRAAGREWGPPIGSEDDEAMGYPDTRMPTPEEVALRGELRECLEETLWRLDIRDRSVLVLRDVEGRPYQEIADAMTTNLGAVKMRIHRARLAFQQLFSRLCPDLWRPAPAGEAMGATDGGAG